MRVLRVLRGSRGLIGVEKVARVARVDRVESVEGVERVDRAEAVERVARVARVDRVARGETWRACTDFWSCMAVSNSTCWRRSASSLLCSHISSSRARAASCASSSPSTLCRVVASRVCGFQGLGV